MSRFKKYEEDVKGEMCFVNERLLLPLFMISRNSFKYDDIGAASRYILKRRRHLIHHCDKTKRDPDYQDRAARAKTRNIRYQKHIAGYYGRAPLTRAACAVRHVTKYNRDMALNLPWQMSPNRYNVNLRPFEMFKGLSGAYWPRTRILTEKEEKMKIILQSINKKPPFRFYDIRRESERMTTTCHKYKGIFVSNAREHRPSTRFMVTNIVLCYRRPEDPAPNTYNGDSHYISNRVSPKIKEKRPNPHIFLPHTTVPAKPNSIHRPHISFLPGPGRYENRFRRVCFCSSRLTYAPDIQWDIDRQKRFKFRRMPYTKIKCRLYCSPQWSHVAGHGFKHLFKVAKKKKAKVERSKPKKTEKTLQMFVDGKYISMITEPNREMISIRDEPMLQLPLKVVYNCLSRRVVKKQLRNNKKIAFMSGMERWKDADRPAVLTVSQLEELKESLPEDRRLYDRPVMNRPLTAIESRLDRMPAHMLPQYELDLRRRLFKFLPLPGPKVLVTENDTRPKGKVYGLYGGHLTPYDYLKPGSKVVAPEE